MAARASLSLLGTDPDPRWLLRGAGAGVGALIVAAVVVMIDVSNYPQLAAVAAKAGLCQPFPAPGDDNVHFSPAGGPECGGARGPVGAGQAFGGNPLSSVSYDVQLVPYGGAGSGGL